MLLTPCPYNVGVDLLSSIPQLLFNFLFGELFVAVVRREDQR
jgi:hypothetical protein